MTSTKYYKVAEHIFEVIFDSSDSLSERMENYKPFEYKGKADDILFSLVVDSPVTGCCPQYDNLNNQEVIADFQEIDKRIVFYKPILLANNSRKPDTDNRISGGVSNYDILFTLPDRNNQFCLLMARDGFTGGRLITKGTEKTRLFGLNNSLMMLFAYAGASEGILLQHASVIKRDGKGYLFLGKSGTGKSTHSRLWLDNIEGCELLNDDNPALGEDKEGSLCVFGTPWSGKTPCYKNEKAVIGGFVKLSQAPANRIRRLGQLQAYAALIPTLSNLKWERPVCDSLNNTVSGIISKIQVYSLDCLPDADAARMSFEALTGEACEKISVRNDLLLGDIKILVNEGRSVSFRVKGNSMLPFVVGGRDSVTLCKKNSYKKGDIVLAEVSKGMFVLHRIFGVKDGRVTLRGDGNSGPKAYEYCRMENIIARADLIVRNGRVIDPYTGLEAAMGRAWTFLNPVRRWLMAIYRRTPGWKNNITDYRQKPVR